MVLAAALGAQPELSGAEGEGARGKARPPQADPDFRPSLGTSRYLFELNGLNIGTGWISTERDGELYRIRYEAGTNGRIDYLYKARYRGEGLVEADSLKPVRAELYQRVRSKTKETVMVFGEGGRITTTEKKTREGEEPESEVEATQAEGFALDPLSAVFLLQGTQWREGKEKTFEVHTGKARYETRFTCEGQAEVEAAGDRRLAWVIAQTSRKLEEKPEEEPRQENPVLRVYVAAEGRPDILRIETTRRVGRITLTLDQFEPAREDASP